MFEKNTVFQIMSVARILRNKLDYMLNEHDITASQFSVLNILYQSEVPLASSQIAAILNSDRPTISGVIFRLEKKGLINRQRDDYDRRVEHLILTEKAKDVIDTLIAKSNSISNEVNQIISETNTEKFNQILMMLSEHFEKEGNNKK
jgi:MarR family transcriptional repressor of mepA